VRQSKGKKGLIQRGEKKKEKKKGEVGWGWRRGERKVRGNAFIIIVGMRGDRKVSGQCLFVLLVR
jgi:hypothetical protein